MSTLVPGYGPLDATWAIIGEAPGAVEDREGKPFVGPSGHLLRDTLERVGLNLDEAYVTNVVKHRPDGNRTPTKKEINAAVPTICGELEHLPALRAVLVVGGTAFTALTGKTGITRNRGAVKVVREEFGDPEWAGYASLHPAAVIRDKTNLLNGFVQDMAAFEQLLNPPEEKVEVLVVDNAIAWEVFKLTIDNDYERAALDIETTVSEAPTGTNRHWADFYNEPEELVCVGCTFDGYRSFVFKNDSWLEQAKPYLEKVEWTMQNGYFDTMAMRSYGWDLKLKHDTMAMAYLLAPEERKSLEILSSVFLGLPPYKTVDYADILNEPFNEVARMNGLDVSRTWKLYRVLADKLNENAALSRLYQWILMPAISELVSVTHRGVPLDNETLLSLAENLVEEREAHLVALRTSTPPPTEQAYPNGWPVKRKKATPTFNPGIPKQVAHVLFDLFGLTPIERTKTGQPSTKADVLLQLILKNSEKNSGPSSGSDSVAWLEGLLAHRKAVKSLGYTESWSILTAKDGRLHPRYKPLHVLTGRLSSEYPNIQQVPRDKRFRTLFTAPEGYSWVKADYSQIELRLAAWAAQEATILEAYRTGEDLHRLTAKLVLGDESDDARQVGKTLNFGLLYEAGPSTLQRVARQDYGVHLSLDEAKAYKEEFFHVYPGLLQWHRDSEHEISRTKQSVSPLGRVRHLPDAGISPRDRERWKERNAALREGLNHPIQSFASDMLLMSLVQLGPRYNVVAVVHDELDFLIPNDEVTAAVKDIQETMEDISWLSRFGISLTVPVLASVEVGPTWGELKEIT